MLAFLHTANAIYLFAYLVRDILWLRVLMVAAMLCMLPFYYCCAATPMYEAISWQSLFIAVNVVQIGLLIYERRPVRLEDDEQRLYDDIFSALSPREFAKLLALSERKHAAEGETLLKQDEPVEQLALISSGSASVELDGRHIAVVEPGQFIGEMGFLTEQNASASVTARVPLDYRAWPADKLRKLLRDQPEVHVKIHGILGADLVEKLRREGFSAAHPSKLMDLYRSGELE
ncbi:MAG: cyclic nucleotide-binding domain-containing protein [Planctomycetota bacterium]